MVIFPAELVKSSSRILLPKYRLFNVLALVWAGVLAVTVMIFVFKYPNLNNVIQGNACSFWDKFLKRNT